MEVKTTTLKDFIELQKENLNEGLVGIGCANYQSWIDGLAGELRDNCGCQGELFSEVFEVTTTGGRHDLIFILNQENKTIDLGKIAVWRVGMADMFKWTSDYIRNYADQHGVVLNS